MYTLHIPNFKHINYYTGCCAERAARPASPVNGLAPSYPLAARLLWPAYRQHHCIVHTVVQQQEVTDQPHLEMVWFQSTSRCSIALYRLPPARQLTAHTDVQKWCPTSHTRKWSGSMYLLPDCVQYWPHYITSPAQHQTAQTAVQTTGGARLVSLENGLAPIRIPGHCHLYSA